MQNPENGFCDFWGNLVYFGIDTDLYYSKCKHSFINQIWSIMGYAKIYAEIIIIKLRWNDCQSWNVIFYKPCFMQEIRRDGLTVEVEIPKTIDFTSMFLLACSLFWAIYDLLFFFDFSLIHVINNNQLIKKKCFCICHFGEIKKINPNYVPTIPC